MQRALWGRGVAAESLAPQGGALPCRRRANEPDCYFRMKVSLILTVYSAILPLFTLTS